MGDGDDKERRVGLLLCLCGEMAKLDYVSIQFSKRGEHGKRRVKLAFERGPIPNQPLGEGSSRGFPGASGPP